MSSVQGQNEQNVCACINATATQINSVYQLNLSLNLCAVGSKIKPTGLLCPPDGAKFSLFEEVIGPTREGSTLL